MRRFDMAICQSETVNSVLQGPDPAVAAADTMFDVRDDLENLAGKLGSLEDLARFLAMEVQGGGNHSETAGAFFSIMNLATGFKDEANALVERLMVLEGVRS
jgi:hypothetical protein